MGKGAREKLGGVVVMRIVKTLSSLVVQKGVACSCCGVA